MEKVEFVKKIKNNLRLVNKLFEYIKTVQVKLNKLEPKKANVYFLMCKDVFSDDNYNDTLTIFVKSQVKEYSIEQLEEFLNTTAEILDKLMMIRNMAVEKYNMLNKMQ